jgi:hypothetical protein
LRIDEVESELVKDVESRCDGYQKAVDEFEIALRELGDHTSSGRLRIAGQARLSAMRACVAAVRELDSRRSSVTTDSGLVPDQVA